MEFMNAKDCFFNSTLETFPSYLSNLSLKSAPPSVWRRGNPHTMRTPKKSLCIVIGY